MNKYVEDYDVVLIGGGFYGLSLAEYFSDKGQKCLILEKDKDVLQRASLINQARVHNGYHYPRSVLTALRSRISYPVFIKDFKEAIVDDFAKYYAVGTVRGNISAKYFESFCSNIGAPLRKCSPGILKKFNPQLIEHVYEAEEVAFDGVILKELMLSRLEGKNVVIKTGSSVERVRQEDSSAKVVVESLTGGEGINYSAKVVVNCTYANINNLNISSKLPQIPMKYQFTEMAIVETTPFFKDKAVTVMCGPFFSFMPFPPRKMHSFSHVTYTPHVSWYSEDNKGIREIDDFARCSDWIKMKLDAQRYLPEIADFKQHDSIFELKALSSASDIDNSRPIIFKRDWGIKNYHCVMGGKIDNIYDIIDYFEKKVGL